MSSDSAPAPFAFEGPLGLIGGSSFLESQALAAFRPVHVITSYGRCILHTNADRSIYFVQRHAADPDHPYSPPHLINKQAIIAALHSLGVHMIIAFGSVGALKRSIPVGSLMIPDDFLDITLKPVSMFEYSKAGHLGPSLDPQLRSSLFSVLKYRGFHPLPSGVYAQSVGPRFESAAEIRLLALQGDIVGMTCAHEAILAQEMKIRYGVICMVDNVANGLAEKAISYEEFHAGVKKNLSTMENVLDTILKHYSPSADAIQKFYSVHGEPSLGQKPALELHHGNSKIVPTSVARIPVDSIIHAKFIIPVVPEDSVLIDHCVVVRDGKIVALLPSSMVHSQYSATHTEYHNSSTLLPGFINCHTHTGMTLLRGYADDYCLHDWLNHHIWPAEAKFVTPEFVEDSAMLAVAEMLKSGTTCFNDMYFYPDIITRVADRTGMRGVMGIVILEFPSSYASNADDYIAKGAALRKNYQNHERIQFAWAPHAPYTVSEGTWSKVQRLQEENQSKKGTAEFTGSKIHTHVHETKAEVEDSVNGTPSSSRHLSDHKCRPLSNLDRLGLIHSDSILVHMTQLDESDFKILEQKKSSVVHCPSSNMKLASGFCPVHELQSRNINVTLGTDSSASNNGLDMWNEIRFAALLGKSVAKNPEAIPAIKALKMATINGARALGLDSHTGSIEVGKFADFQVVSLDNLELIPIYDLIPHLVYAGSSRHVTDVWVAGIRIIENRRFTQINEREIFDRTIVWQNRLRQFRVGRENKFKANSSNVVLEAPSAVEKH